jgi:hypothetical protein
MDLAVLIDRHDPNDSSAETVPGRGDRHRVRSSHPRYHDKSRDGPEGCSRDRRAVMAEPTDDRTEIDPEVASSGRHRNLRPRVLLRLVRGAGQNIPRLRQGLRWLPTSQSGFADCRWRSTIRFTVM